MPPAVLTQIWPAPGPVAPTIGVPVGAGPRPPEAVVWMQPGLAAEKALVAATFWNATPAELLLVPSAARLRKHSVAGVAFGRKPAGHTPATGTAVVVMPVSRLTTDSPWLSEYIVAAELGVLTPLSKLGTHCQNGYGP